MAISLCGCTEDFTSRTSDGMAIASDDCRTEATNKLFRHGSTSGQSSTENRAVFDGAYRACMERSGFTVKAGD
ncbi:MAG TPA: hypothetical protein VGB91_16725 [Rhizomicrobium sp.]